MINLNTEKPQSNEYSEGLDYVNPGLPHVTFVVDFLPSGEFRFVRVNSLGESVMGLAPEMIQGKTLSQLFPEAIAHRMAANFTRSWQLNQSISYEELWPSPEGEDCWIVTLFPLSNEASSGENHQGDREEAVSGDRADNFPVTTGENCPVNRLIGVSVNLTELQKNQRLSIFTNSGDRQTAENQLLSTQTRFETALKNSAIAVFQQDRQLRYTWAYNPHDVDAEAILGKTDLELLPHEDALHLVQMKQQVLDTGIGCREEVKITIAGQINFYDLTIEPLYDTNQNLIGITCATMKITDRKEGENALKEAYKRLKFHVENTPLGVIEWDREFKVKYWSKNAEKIFGWQAEEVLGKYLTYWQFIHPDDLDKINRQIDQLLKQGETDNFIANRNYTKDGSVVDCEWYNSALTDDSGQPISILSLVQDVTHRKQTEKKLKKALKKIEHQNKNLELKVAKRTAKLKEINEQLQKEILKKNQAQYLIKTIADTIPQLLYIYDVIQQRNVYANDRHREFYGCSQEEIQGGGFGFYWDRFHPDDIGIMREFEARLAKAKDGEVLENELRVKNAAGEWRWLHTSDVILSRTPEGLPEQIVGTAIDVTDRKKNEEKLQFQAQLLNNVRESIIATDLTGHIIYWSPASEILYGYPAAEVMGKLVNFIVEPHEAEEEAARMHQAIETGYWTGQYWQKRQDGSSFWANTTISVATDSTGKPFGLIGVDRDITEIKEAQEKLYQREQEFKALVENSPDVINRFDRQLRHVYVNPAVERVTGISPEKLIGKTNEKLGICPDILLVWNQRIERVFKTGEDQVIDFEFATTKGVKSYQSHFVPEYGRDGSVEFVMAVSRDITELKQVKEELRSSRDFLDAVLETANEGITVSNEQGQFILYNQKMQEITGYSKEEAEHPDYLSWIYPDYLHRAKALGARSSAFRGRNITNQDWQILHKDGSTRTVLISTKLLTYNQQKWLISMVRDISDRYQTEKALRQSEEKYRVLVETLPCGIREIDLSGRITLINSAGLQILGYQREELQGKSIWSLGAGESPPEHLATYFRHLINHKLSPSVYTTKHRRQDGSMIDVEVTWNYRRDHSGEVIGFVSVITDVTARKQAEEELQASLQEKELLIKEVHHRVKNNLQVISSIFSLQSLYIQDPQILSILAESQNRIRSMALIHEKLYQSNNLAQVDFADYLKSLTRNLFDSYNVNPNAIALNLQVNNVDLNLDTAIACGLLINELVSNALKHGFPHREAEENAAMMGEITIVFSQVSPGTLFLEVKDNGVGLPKEVNIGETNSLGLRLVRALTRQLRGQLEIQNQGGTVFHLTFPQPQEHRRF
jgi:PAS domain S-box-containing protein